MGIAYLNGDFLPLEDARISPMDRGFLFADGVYEVIPVYQDVPFRLEQHLQRLENSLHEIQLDNPMDREGWSSLFHQLVQHNGGGNLAMTTPVTTPAADSPDTAEGVSAITLDDIRWARCDIKSVALLANVMMRQMAVSQGAAEAILIRDGFATEGSASNFFIVSNGVVITPPKSHLILPGITRDLVVELCQRHGVPIEEREITETELRGADEVWLSSSTKEVVPVVSLNGHELGDGKPGPVWKTVARHYVTYKRELCGVA
jgi:D-alanine transaminase